MASTRKSAAQEIRNQIEKASAHGFPFYVYALEDAQGVFYIGKGTRSRVFAHEREARTKPLNAAKCARIRKSNFEISYRVLAYFNDEQAAYGFEREQIKAHESLTNVAPGCGDRKQAVIEQFRLMLENVVPFEETALAKNPDRFPYKLMGAKTARDFYDRLISEIKKEIANPTPRTITIGRDNSVRYGW